MKSEEWRKIPGYPSRYEVSDFGRIKTVAYDAKDTFLTGTVRLRSFPEKILTPCSVGSGYLAFWPRAKRRTILYVHRAVALAFIPNPECRREVNHKNGDKADNRLVNLEWATASENGLHSFAELGRINGRAVLSKEQVNEIRLLCETRPQGEIAAKFGISKNHVGRIKRREKWASA